MVLFLLGIAELREYLKYKTHSELFVQTLHRDEKLNANIDIVFPYVPCDILAVNLKDNLEN